MSSLIVIKSDGKLYAYCWSRRISIKKLKSYDPYECWPNLEGCKCKNPKMLWIEGGSLALEEDLYVFEVLGFECYRCGSETHSIKPLFRLKPKWRYENHLHIQNR